MTAMLRVEEAGSHCEALLDTGASRSFITPGAVERLQLKVWKLSEECVFTVANGAKLRIDRVVKGLTMWCGATRLSGDFLDVNQQNGGTQGVRQRTPAEQAYDALARQIAGMTREEATALLRPPPKRYKTPAKGRRKAVVAALIQQATENAACIRHPFQGLYAMLALPAVETNVALRLVEERQGALCCGLPPKRPHDHRILLVPGKLPTKSAIYRMAPEQLQFHKQEIAKLSANGWIGPTYSPISARTIMVDKRSDGTGARKMRMVVNYQELNALTIAPDFPLPPIQTILEMLGGAQYFSTLDLESGFHQIRMAKEDR
ncbi:Polyprotein, related [Eimeria brunetti]|uniref:Polyprotein, related n=1 Tax=Eimeria brunetti TaxID=51314 RepID=U6LKY5_9EIME|nr:Polyprotein, related [Eimeria brunetti]